MTKPGFEEFLDDLNVAGNVYRYVSLKKFAKSGFPDINLLPYSLKILLENLLRTSDCSADARAKIEDLASWAHHPGVGAEVGFSPARLMMPESSGLPLIADLAAMRAAMTRLGGDPSAVNPQKRVDVIIDHSVTVDVFGQSNALQRNLEIEYSRNSERYAFLRWAQGAFKDLHVVPPGVGICHQINLEFLAKVVWHEDGLVFPDTLIAMDSHTPMINALGILGWGVGGNEAGAAMLGQPITMRIPEVIGCRLTGELAAGITATDVALTVTQALRARGVVQTFVEFCGSGLDELSIPDRATIANMAPEYGSTTGFFPVDQKVLDYLTSTGRDDKHIQMVKAYCKVQGLWRDSTSKEPVFTDIVEVRLDDLERCVAGPKLPHSRVALGDAPASVRAAIADAKPASIGATLGAKSPIRSGDVAIAAITSCTNAGNPELMVQAGLFARNARAKGLTSKPWVKTSMGPASRVIADLLKRADLQSDLDDLGFNVVGFGCTTCVGNSGTLAPKIRQAIADQDLTVGAVTSANRNFEGRTNPLCRIHYLASPPMVVAYAITGTLEHDFDNAPLGMDSAGNPVLLTDIWPTRDDIADAMSGRISPEDYRKRNAEIYEGDAHWKALEYPDTLNYDWDSDSMYLRKPPFLDSTERNLTPVKSITGARTLVMLDDFITTDHISPVGTITADSEAGQYLLSCGIAEDKFNSFASRRVNHPVMIRGTFANIRLRNNLVPGTEGGVTRLFPDDKVMSIYETAMIYQARDVPTVILAGKGYGAGSSRDWAAKGTYLLGVKAIISESFERIHRSNLVDMAVLPLEFEADSGWRSLGLDGSETFDIDTSEDALVPLGNVACTVTTVAGESRVINLRCRIDTAHEMAYFRNGGILPYTLRKLLAGTPVEDVSCLNNC